LSGSHTNSSLYIFAIEDYTRSKLLDWKKRFKIIEGISQGLLYLLKYSRLKVIHRDLKASNILLDENMNPKISQILGWPEYSHNKNQPQIPTKLLGHSKLDKLSWFCFL